MKNFLIFSLITVGLMLVACSDSGTGPSGPTLSVADKTVTEGTTLGFVVTLSQTVTDDVTFSYATANVSAVAGSDYTAASGVDTIPAGQTSVTISVNTTDDAVVESNETLTLTISAAVNATISDGIATGTILDNDGAAGVSFANDVRPLLVNNCAIANCHGNGFSQGGMTMGNATYNEIMAASGTHGVIVVSGSSATSNMYLKTTDTPPFGARMPANGNYLSTTDQNKIKDWIDQGANNN